MRAGQLRHLVRVESVRKTRTAAGGFEDTFTLAGEAYASIMPLTGREFFENQSVNGDVTHEIKMRAHLTVVPGDRIIHDARTFHVLSSVDVAERGISQRIMAKESV